MRSHDFVAGDPYNKTPAIIFCLLIEAVAISVAEHIKYKLTIYWLLVFELFRFGFNQIQAIRSSAHYSDHRE